MFQFWYVVPRKILQPCMTHAFSEEYHVACVCISSAQLVSVVIVLPPVDSHLAKGLRTLNTIFVLHRAITVSDTVKTDPSLVGRSCTTWY
jgi:hypothetical protein